MNRWFLSKEAKDRRREKGLEELEGGFGRKQDASDKSGKRHKSRFVASEKKQKTHAHRLLKHSNTSPIYTPTY